MHGPGLCDLGRPGQRRAELERLLAANTRDTQLLQQLSKLAEEEGDLESAARYQKQLNELAPSDDGATRLGQLYAPSGELEEAQAVWSKMASGKSEAHRIFQAIDSLLAQKKPQPVLEITESMLRKDPRDWEALYRQGLALVDLDKPAEAARRFQAILDLTLVDDEKSAPAPRRGPATRSSRPAALARIGRQRPAVRSMPLRGSDQHGLADPHCLQARQPVSVPPRAGDIWAPARLRPSADGGPGLAAQPSAIREGPDRKRRADRAVPQSQREDAGRPARSVGLVLSLLDAQRQRRRFTRPAS